MPARIIFVVVALASACGIPVQPLEAFDVVIRPNTNCTLTGSTSQDCTDPEDLEQQTITGRWVVEHGPAGAFTLTTEEGQSLPGIYFNDDGFVLSQAPCVGQGGLCYFARDKHESIDDRNNGCREFAESVVILRRTDEVTMSGIFNDTQGADEACGTSTVVVKAADVELTRADEPALARKSAEGTP
jgi:hypothetical protein